MVRMYPGLERVVMAVGEYAMVNEVVRAAGVLHQALVMGCEVGALPVGVVRAGEELSLVLEAWEHRAVDMFDADARARGRMESVRSGALGCGSGSGWCDCTPDEG